MSRAARRPSRFVALLAALALAVALVEPAGATTAESDSLVFVPLLGSTATVWRNGHVVQPVHFPVAWPVEGDFSGAPGADVFFYNPGSEPDGILHVTPSGTAATTSFRSVPVNGDYRPLVGDFDGNAIDDIFWYAAGPATDYLWRFDAAGNHVSQPQAVNGDYQPRVMDVDGSVGDDIIWYAPGPAKDSIWRFTGTGSHTTRSVTINGRYISIPGHFQNVAEGSPQERLIWWNPSGPDYVWTFDTAANHTSVPMTNVDGGDLTMPIVGTFMDPVLDSVLFYSPGAATEVFRSFTAAGEEVSYEPPQVAGLYLPAVGDYDGNGYQDIAWSRDGGAYIWKFNGGGYTQTTVVTDTVDALVCTAFF